MDTESENPKNYLHKLLKEYESNCGMAGMVCGVPVSLMPDKEQDRLFNGFCTEQNLRVFSDSRKNLMATQQLDLDASEADKVESAIQTLTTLHSAIDRFMKTEIDKPAFCELVRSTLEKPIPTSEEDLVTALSRVIETLLFLSTQNLSEKDDWDKMVDCVQLHDALSRAMKICDSLQSHIGTTEEGAPSKSHGESVQQTLEFCNKHSAYLESFFRGESPSEHLQPQFGELFAELSRVWGDDAG